METSESAGEWRNMATWDRLLRVAVGLGTLGLGISGAVPSPWDVALEILSLMPLVTGLLGWCPIYAMLGHDGCRRRID